MPTTICAPASGTARSNWKIPIAFRPFFPTSIFICSAKVIISRFTTSLALTRWIWRAWAASPSWSGAPNAQRVSVVGDFNLWDGRRHAMRVRGERLLGNLRAWSSSRREIQIRNRNAGGRGCSEGRSSRALPGRSVPSPLRLWWTAMKFPRPPSLPAGVNSLDADSPIYEVHLGSWRRKGEHGQYWLNYRELAEQLPAYAVGMGSTHVELLPVTGRPFRRFVGLSAHRTVRADKSLRHASRICGPCRSIARCRRRRVARLGAGTFPGRSSRARTFRRHRHLRACRTRCKGGTSTGARLIYNYGRTEVANFPARKCALLARSLQGRRIARRCRRINALSRL